MKVKPAEKPLRENAYLVPALYRGMKLLEFLAERPGGCSMADMAGLALPAATLFRMLTTLQHLGYVVRDAQDRFRVTGRLLMLGHRAYGHESLVEKAMPFLRDLCAATGETCLIGVLQSGQGIVLGEVASKQPVKVTVQIGHAFPLHTAAPAKAMLAFLPEDELQTLLKDLAWTRFTRKTIRTEGRLRQVLDEVRSQGYALDCGEEVEDIRCVAAPVLDYRGRPVAAVWLSGPASRLPDDTLPALAIQVMRCAGQISQ